MVSDFYTKECQLPVFDREETILLRRTKSHDQGKTMKDYYKILEISESASEEVIHMAYKALVKIQ